MTEPRARGRLFRKLLLALFASMLLSMLGTVGYLRLTSAAPPPPSPDFAMLGPFPLVPLVSGLLAMLVTGLLLAWYLAKPLSHLRHALRRVAEGDLETRVGPLIQGRNDEIADLAQDFDRMVGRLQQLTASRQVLLHDISHELRSPLARLQVAIGLLRQDPSDVVAMTDRIERESQRLDALIEELLTLHRLEAAPGTFARARVDVVELLQAVAEDAEFEATAAQRQVTIVTDGPFIAQVDGQLLCRAFENVIRNAVKFTPAGTTVEIEARVRGDVPGLAVTVRDRGPVVPASDLDAVFDPFVRLEGAGQVQGSGLGLAIARRALALHGGTIVARARAGGGLEVELRLPSRTSR